MGSHLVRTLSVVAVLCSFETNLATAQSQLHPRWERPGFDFRKDGVWRVRARRVAESRRTLLARGRLAELNAPITSGTPNPSATAVTGSLKVPYVLLSYPGIDSVSFMHDTAEYSTLLFGATAPPGLPYSLNSFYDQLSNGLFGIQGRVSRWARLQNAEVAYTGTPSTECAITRGDGLNNCNGIFSGLAISQLHNGLREALARVDTGAGGMNFAAFDNDGPDGIPNSGDDDGFVDLTLFGHPTQDGACVSPTNNHIWAHRFTLSVTATYTTNDARAGGGFIRVADYLIQSALGGATGCDVTSVMPIGIVAHELGHGLGLPDLYDIEGLTQGPSVGIGRWGLMSMGGDASPRSPARMEAWSLNELGWVTVDTITATGIYSLDAAPLSDTTFFVNVQGTNTRGEYFLLENRQASQADTALIRSTCQKSGTPAGCAGGLLIWHIDGTKMNVGSDVNHGPIHGLALVQADGFRNLEANEETGPICSNGDIVNGCSDRGDAGDPYPGTSGNPALGFLTNPAATKNLDGSFVGFAVDQITQVVPGRQMSFRLRFGDLTVVRASDSAATIQFDAGTFNVFRDLLDEGSSHTVSFPDPQVSANGRTRWRFASWSDGGAVTHAITGSLSGDTLTANVNRDFKLIATVSGNGTIQPDTAINLAGTFIAEGRAVTLTATAGGSEVFGGWSGDTVTTNNILALPMGRPYTVVASFGALVISTAAARPNGVMGAAYADTLRATGGTGVNSWTITTGALPQGLTLDAATGVISGFPRQTGNFTYTATVTSGAQSQNRVFTMSVSAPTLATADVVTQLLGSGSPLTTDQVRYLDFLGNNNTAFDIGDFLAWVKATGAPLSAAMLQVIEKEGGRP